MIYSFMVLGLIIIENRNSKMKFIDIFKTLFYCNTERWNFVCFYYRTLKLLIYKQDGTIKMKKGSRLNKNSRT